MYNNSNNNKPRATLFLVRLAILAIAGLVFAFGRSPSLGLVLIICLPFIFIIIAIITAVAKNRKNNQASQPSSTLTFPGLSSYNGSYSPNADADAHLCDDGDHSSTDTPYAQSLDKLQGGYTASAPSTSRYSAAISKEELAAEYSELDSLLASGIMTKEEYDSRKRELSSL
jgi:ABC-type transport system involved in cytochrome bd biosynthesis, ATPase and permease components